MKNKKLLLRIIVYALISILIYWGFYGFFNNLNDTNAKFKFLFELGLLGIFVGTLVSTCKKDAKHWSDKEFNLYGNLGFSGSLLIIIFLGFQGIYFSLSNEYTFPLIFIGDAITSLGAVILFTSLIGLLVITVTKVYKVLT